MDPREHPLTTIARSEDGGSLVRRLAEVIQRERETHATGEGLPHRLRTVLSKIPAILHVHRGEAHVFEVVSEDFQRLLGDQQVIGKTMREAFPHLDEALHAHLDEVYRTGEPYDGRELPVLLRHDPSGRSSERFFNLSYRALHGPSGEVEGVLGFAVDVTENVRARKEAEALAEALRKRERERIALLELETASRKALEDQSRAIEASKDEFLGMVSHELRTPLNAVLGWARMLREGAVPEAKRPRALEAIERNALAQARLIEDLLDISRIATGKLRLCVGAVDLVQVLSAAAQSARAAAQAKRIELTLSLDPDAGPITGDPERLQQVAWNLLSNAVKFTPSGGRVEMTLQGDGSHVEITVQDSGQGLSPELIDHVFERFWQAEVGTTRTHGGLGLGLTLVRHLVELHGGTVHAHSEGPGRGSTFVVRLPRGPQDQDRITPRPAPRTRDQLTPPPAGEPQLDGLRVLVIDDDQDTLELIAAALENERAVAVTATTAAEALALVQRFRPDVIVSDLGMPCEDGFSLIQKIRSLPPEQGGRTPAVALSAHTGPEARTHALLAGFDMHAGKPIDPRELIVITAKLTNRIS
jgi:PAS domain S-box-containing protein